MLSLEGETGRMDGCPCVLSRLAHCSGDGDRGGGVWIGVPPLVSGMSSARKNFASDMSLAWKNLDSDMSSAWKNLPSGWARPTADSGGDATSGARRM